MMLSNKKICPADIYAGRYGLQIVTLSLLRESYSKIGAKENGVNANKSASAG